MSDEFESINNSLPDLGSVLTQRIMAKKGSESSISNGFDPYQSLLKKKENNGEVTFDVPIQTWPEESVKALEDYCKRVGIVGYNCGKMNPIIALSLLKKQVGDYSEVPLEERIPDGYEPIIKRKEILYG